MINKNKVEALIALLKSEGRLNATEFFKTARSGWAKNADGDQLVEEYNRSLGRLFGRGDLTYDEVNRAMRP